MRDGRAVWIALSDLLLCVLCVVIVAVAPVKAKIDGVKTKAEFLITMESSVDIDADPDLWVILPSKKPVFYGAREVGCATLDGDPVGFSSNIVTLANGTTIKVETDKETMALRCLDPGHYDVGVNLFSYRYNGVGQDGKNNGLGLKCHVEIVSLNPTVRLMFAGDVILNSVGQTVNVVSFDLSPTGDINIVNIPLELVTAPFR